MTGRDMRTGLALAAALLPLAASGVTLTVNNTSSGILVGESACKSLQLVIRWDLGGAPSSTDRVRVIGARSGSGVCGTTNATTAPDDTIVPETQPSSQVESVTIPAQRMVLSTSDAGVQPCDDPDVTSRSSANPLSNTICVQLISNATLGNTSLATASVPIKFALAPPFPPDNILIAPGDSHLKISWSPGDPAETIATYDVHVVPQGEQPDGGVAAHTTATNADVTKTDHGQKLENDAGYDITIVAHDTYDNFSEPSIEVLGVPVATADFYNHYRDLGGDATGGCTSGGGSALIAVAALAVALLLRRRAKARNGAALVAVLALMPPAARAEERRPPRYLIAFKIDRYDPKVDSETGLVGTPYHDVFGPRAPGRYQLEFDWEVAHPLGSVLVGATAGFWQNHGKGILRSSPPDAPVPSEDTTTLNVFPFGLILTYRFDYLADRWERFPFIPYAQFGLMRALWTSYNGTGDLSYDRVNGGKGSGWTNGYTTALGVALNLNAIDPTLAREAYLDTGIQRTSLFAEYGWTTLNGWGKKGALVLSDHAWRFGLSVEF
jgi:uncharacterized protein (TIGR03382 family)